MYRTILRIDAQSVLTPAQVCAHIAFTLRLEFYGNVAVVLVGISAVARLGYYVVYGKEGGAKPLPRRSDA